jgi:hypothetical protein
MKGYILHKGTYNAVIAEFVLATSVMANKGYLGILFLYK